MRVTKVTLAENCTVYSQWKIKKVVICNGANGAMGVCWSWTNTTGKTLTIYYSLLCENDGYSSIWVGGYGDGIEVAFAGAGDGTQTGSFTIAPNQILDLYNYVDSVSTTYMYYNN